MRKVNLQFITYGVKDCHSFYEMYSNRIGNLLRLPNIEYRGAAKLFRHNDVDVPLLLNRSLGQMIKNYEALTNNHSSIELGGPVLPCFVREPLLDEVADVGSQQSFPIPICVIRSD